MKQLICVSLALTSLSACATITTGTSQSILVKTPKVEEASCDLTDSKGGSWHVKSTPAHTTVRKGDGPMTIICEKDGYNKGMTTIDDKFVMATAGNILIGGGIGVIVDSVSGAAQKYPDEAVVWMEPKKWKSTAAKKEWLAEKEAYEAEQKAKEEAAREAARPRNRRN